MNGFVASGRAGSCGASSEADVEVRRRSTKQFIDKVGASRIFPHFRELPPNFPEILRVTPGISASYPRDSCELPLGFCELPPGFCELSRDLLCRTITLSIRAPYNDTLRRRRGAFRAHTQEGEEGSVRRSVRCLQSRGHPTVFSISRVFKI